MKIVDVNANKRKRGNCAEKQMCIDKLIEARQIYVKLLKPLADVCKELKCVKPLPTLCRRVIWNMNEELDDVDWTWCLADTERKV